jgi:hypothetical protein
VKAKQAMTAPVSPVVEERSLGRSRRGIAAAVVGLLALGACTSDPGPKRVAQDIIKAESLANPELNEECLLDELDNYSNAELEEISAGLEKDNSADQAEAEEALAQYAADLESCL